MQKQRIIAGLPENLNIPATTGMNGGRRKENQQA
jgi:hypothetical protein